MGFTVAGYSFMIGLIHVGMINKITEPLSKENKFSLYQKSSATFCCQYNNTSNITSLCLSISFVRFF